LKLLSERSDFDLQNEKDFQRQELHAKVKQNAIAISRLRKEKHGYFFFFGGGGCFVFLREEIHQNLHW
jgi:hypothetical protein